LVISESALMFSRDQRVFNDGMDDSVSCVDGASVSKAVSEVNKFSAAFCFDDIINNILLVPQYHNARPPLLSGLL